MKAFSIKQGMKVLEIGCGQGDTTVALADAVGKDGKVVAIDVASTNYGAPLTLGQATEQIKNSSLGNRITFHFETDVSNLDSDQSFDAVVLSHCSWYFKQPELLLDYFKKIRSMTNHLYFAEWDLDFKSLSQRSHFCAVMLQALYTNFIQNDGNIQNLFSKQQVHHYLKLAGFQIEKELTVDATYLQDGQWEKEMASELKDNFVNIPPKIHTLVQSFYDLMNQSEVEEQSLNSFVICAK